MNLEYEDNEEEQESVFQWQTRLDVRAEFEAGEEKKQFIAEQEEALQKFKKKKKKEKKDRAATSPGQLAYDLKRFCERRIEDLYRASPLQPSDQAWLADEGLGWPRVLLELIGRLPNLRHLSLRNFIAPHDEPPFDENLFGIALDSVLESLTSLSLDCMKGQIWEGILARTRDLQRLELCNCSFARLPPRLPQLLSLQFEASRLCPCPIDVSQFGETLEMLSLRYGDAPHRSNASTMYYHHLEVEEHLAALTTTITPEIILSGQPLLDLSHLSLKIDINGDSSVDDNSSTDDDLSFVGYTGLTMADAILPPPPTSNICDFTKLPSMTFLTSYHFYRHSSTSNCTFSKTS